MEMKPSLNLSLRPALIMTPRLQQALKLLQVPTLELQQILKQEMIQNPLLEEVDEAAESEDLAKEDSPEEKANEEAEDPAEEDPIDWSEYMQDGALDRVYVPPQETSVEFLEKVPITRTTLAESLLEQLHFLELAPADLVLAEFLVGSLDDRGWLATPLEEVAQATGEPLERCESVLKVIQALEPVGWGARPARVPAHPARGARRARHAALEAHPRPVRQPREPALPRDRPPAQGLARAGAGGGRRHRPAEPQAGGSRSRARIPSTSYPTSWSNGWTTSTSSC
jgi:DNA-directed RNA polymerase specialized sigma subunit, sigma54 homolog